jgi:hypothetical protein
LPKHNKFVWEDLADATVGFAASFGIEYVILRYIFHAGHVSVLIAYGLASIYGPLRAIRRRVS